MKIKSMSKTYEEVMALPRPEHKKPDRPSRALSVLIHSLVGSDLKKVDFTRSEKRMEKAGDGPWLIFMNHSSFLDLEIASAMLYPRLYHIVCTSDGLVGKEGLMRAVGCIPTQKFVSDLSLISDMKHALHKNRTSVLMYPEASYSFDGTATPLPRKMGVLLKALKVPLVMITAYGSFARDPLYNNLQKRNVKVSAEMECLLTVDEIRTKSIEEIDEILDRAFSFDYFKWQQENRIRISEDFRADGLERILFKCPHCLQEGCGKGKGISWICGNCGKEYELDEYGWIKEVHGDTLFASVPDWYRWEREMVRKEIEEGNYLLDTDVEIGLIVDFKALYMVGSGHLRHDRNGFVLDGCDGALHYEQGPLKCYSVYSDYYWYEIGDVICIGNKDCLYYCFPKKKDVVAKTRIAVEELYKMNKNRNNCK